MGWWPMNPNGGINWTDDKKDSSLINNVPGRDDPKNAVMGDGPADIMDIALDKIEKEYLEDWKRKPYEVEYEGCFNFCMAVRRSNKDKTEPDKGVIEDKLIKDLVLKVKKLLSSVIEDKTIVDKTWEDVMKLIDVYVLSGGKTDCV